jgi:hypothetical protein
MDLMYGDRSIMEDIVSRLGAVENALHLNREHQTEVQKDLKADIAEAGIRTEDKVDEVKQVIKDNTVIVKSPHRNIIEWITNRLKGGKAHESKNK